MKEMTLPSQREWVGDAFDEALSKLNPAEGFKGLGYVYEDDASYDPKIRDFDYSFDASLIPLPAAPMAVAVPKPAPKGGFKPLLILF